MARARLPGRWPLGKAACKFILHSGEKPLRMAAAERKSEQVTQRVHSQRLGLELGGLPPQLAN